MTRESAAEKARRYLVEGRLRLVRVTPHTAAAVVRGDGAVHHINASPAGWTCTCPARGRCAHELALGLVVALDGPNSSSGAEAAAGHRPLTAPTTAAGPGGSDRAGRPQPAQHPTRRSTR